jgi:hypothetical protein
VHTESRVARHFEIKVVRRDPVTSTLLAKAVCRPLMDIQQLFADSNWQVEFHVDPNVGGDGQRVRLSGDSTSFRKLASLLSAMADTVDDPSHPSSKTGWHLSLNPQDLQQLILKNAAILTLNCEPSAR